MWTYGRDPQLILNLILLFRHRGQRFFHHTKQIRSLAIRRYIPYVCKHVGNERTNRLKQLPRIIGTQGPLHHLLVEFNRRTKRRDERSENILDLPITQGHLGEREGPPNKITQFTNVSNLALRQSMTHDKLTPLETSGSSKISQLPHPSVNSFVSTQYCTPPPGR